MQPDMMRTGRNAASTASGPNHNRTERDMADKLLPTPETLRQLLRYEPETGKLYWRPIASAVSKRDRCWNGKYAGKEAITSDNGNGYRVGRLQGYRKMYAHRTVWALVHGHWPEHDIDHINGIRDDNRLNNLRQATRSENMMNTPAHRDNASGVKGVFWCTQKLKWSARITVEGNPSHLGYFSTKDAAGQAQRTAALQLHGDFARL